MTIKPSTRRSSADVGVIRRFETGREGSGKSYRNENFANLRAVSPNAPEQGHAFSFLAPAVLEHTLSEEEHNQIVQTIEMFEAITQTQPDDYQSLEILKEAYSKVGKSEEAMKVSRRLAEAYFNVGSYTLAMQECEAILAKENNAPDILAMLGDIEARLQASGHAISNRTAAMMESSNGGDGSLIQMNSGQRAPVELGDRGDE